MVTKLHKNTICYHRELEYYFIINSELFKMDEENLEKKDLKYVRQSMYSERRKLHPAQPKNQAEFHSILDDNSIFLNGISDIFTC
jgi:hypothetical protein